MREFQIGKRLVGEGHPAYIIAEIGVNHQGDLAHAKLLIDKAIEAGADAVKFQKRSLKDVYTGKVLETAGEAEEHGTHYVLHHILKTELSDDDMREACRYAREKGIEFLCSPWDEKSLEFLSSLELPAYKVGSADMFNLRLLGKIAALKKPMLISTGMSFVTEIDEVAEHLKKLGAEFMLLHCNSTYPAPYHDINLKFLTVLKNKYGMVGYSGHEQGTSISCAAVAMGAKVIERHITTDKTLPGPDHNASLLPEEFGELVREIRNVELALGDGVRFPSRGEYLNRETLSKSIVAAKDLSQGHVLTDADLDLKSPGKGTSPMKLDLFIGKTLERDIPKDGYILESDIGLRPQALYGEVRPKHQWGVVARMSDIDELMGCKSDFVEIHLTSSDVHADETYDRRYNVNVGFHGPEYDNDLLLDLSSLDETTRGRSIEFFNRALAHARKVKKLFKNGNDNVQFVIHPGGMHIDRPLIDRIPELNRNLADSLKKLDADGFTLLIENMPGCPWYFGGQWHHASFMAADEIAEFSKTHGYGVVFDTSHAALYCNQYKKDLTEYAKTILPVAQYVHISDGAKWNGEGLQIGDGTIDWKPLLEEVTKKDIWFLPEIWQGHKFGGEGFMRAVHTLSSLHPRF